MLIEYNFVLSQVRYVRAAMILIPSFKPDDSVLSTVDSIIGNAKQVRQDYLAKDGLLSLARGAVHEALDRLHEANVAVYASLKSVYRRDMSSMSLIESIPVDDQSVGDTFTRGKSIDTKWGQLANPPGWGGAFTLGPITHAVFTGYVTALETAVGALEAADGSFQLSEGFLHRTQAAMSDFVTAALQQGRAQFDPGSPERDVIDRVPTASATQPPGQAVISSATSSAAGTLHAEFDAPHATSFEVWRKGPGDGQFVLVEEAIKPGVYNATGLPAGSYELQIVGENSRGEGPASVTATVQVAAAAVA